MRAVYSLTVNCLKCLAVLTFLLRLANGFGEYPKVSLLKWMAAEGFEWEYENLTSELIAINEVDHQTTYTVAPSLFAMAVACNASYPVQWIFKHYDRTKMYNVRVRSYRTTDNIFDVKSFKFASILVIYSDSNSVTGEYSCQKTDSEQTKNNIYIYWLGGSPPYFLHAGKTLTVKSEDGDTLLLPCIVSSPEISEKVILHKQNGTDDYIPVSTDPGSIDWDPRTGFRLNLKKIQSPYGHYKCEIGEGEDQEDFVYIVAVQGRQPKLKMITNSVTGNATFDYDKVSRRIKCCSTTATRPVMTKIYCSDPLSCKLKEFAVFQGGNNGVKPGNGSCTLGRKFYRESGVVRCKGDGVDAVRHFFSPIVRNDTDGPGIYFNWADADVSKLIEIRTTTRSSPHFYSYSSQPSSRLYSNQSFYIICDASNYYFAQGLHFALKWRNQTVQYLNESTSFDAFYFGFDMRRNFQLVAHIHMIEATCWAPVWNSTVWVNKTYPLNVIQSIAPVISGSPVEDVQWSLDKSNQTIVCVTKVGEPLAKVQWTKNDRIIVNDSNTGVTFANGSSTLIFKKASLDTHGEYKCVAKNVAGVAEKTVRVTVASVAKSSTWGALGITIMVLVSLALAGGIGVLIWRMKLQKRIIDHLAGIMFRDLSGSQPTPSQGSVHQVLE